MSNASKVVFVDDREIVYMEKLKKVAGTIDPDLLNEIMEEYMETRGLTSLNEQDKKRIAYIYHDNYQDAVDDVIDEYLLMTRPELTRKQEIERSNTLLAKYYRLEDVEDKVMKRL
jgi:hypothetical protein